MPAQTKATRQDIKYILPERVGDYPDSGGMPSNNYVSNDGSEVFDPIASFDRANGDVSVRLLYVGLQRPDDVPLYKSFFAITEPSDDPAVTHLVMQSKKFNETRADIVSDATSNIVLDESRLQLVKDKRHLQGDTEISVVVSITVGVDDEHVFSEGDILYIQGEYTVSGDYGDAKKTYGEYVRVSEIISQTQSEPIDNNGEQIFNKTYELSISTALKNNYTADYIILNNVQRYKTDSFSAGVYKTRFAGRSRYYGIKALSANANMNSNTIQVENTHAHIAPMLNGGVVEIADIDVLKLSPDGLVQILQKNDEILITNAQRQNIGEAHTSGGVVQLDRSNLQRICVSDSKGTPVSAQLWNYELNAGTIKWSSSLDLSEYVMPIYVKHVQEEVNTIIKVNANNTLELLFNLLHDYPASGTYVSSILPIGDLQVRHSIPFTQRNWDGVWRDEPQGDQLLNKLNLTDYPMILTDNGAIRDRWMIKFKSSTQFELYSEAMGYIGTYDTLTDLAPIRPATGKPYFVIPSKAFGVDAPWATQDVIRFNTWATIEPLRLIRVVDPNRNESADDSMTMCLFGDTTKTGV